MVGAFGGCEVVKECADTPRCRRDAALGGLAPRCLEFGEDLLDGIEIEAVGRANEQLGATERWLEFVKSQSQQDAADGDDR